MQKQAAVAIILKKENNKKKVLLVKRIERKEDPWSGDIAFPGGIKENSDKNIFETVLREIKEEIGLDLKNEKLIFELKNFYPRSKKVPKIKVKPFVFLLKNKKRIIKGDEIEEVFWIDISKLKKKKVKIKKINQNRIAFIYKNYIIWGLTYRILKKVKEIIKII